VQVLTTEADIPLDVQLGTYKLAAKTEKPELVLMEESSKSSKEKSVYKETKRISMTQNKNGLWALEVPATNGQVVYKIAGARPDSQHTVQGTSATSYFHNETSGYLSVLKSSESKITVLFDPSKLPASDKKPSMTFAKSNSSTAQIASLHWEMNDYSSKFWAARNADKNEEPNEQGAQGEELSVYNWQTQIQKRLIANEPQDTLLRHALLLAYFNLPLYFLEDEGGEPALTPTRWIEEILDTMKPKSPLWGFSSSASNIIGQSVSAAFFDNIAKQTDDPEIAAQIALKNIRTAASYKLKARQKEYYKALETTLANTSTGRRFEKKKERYRPDHPFKKGNPVPTFSLAAFSKPETKLSPKIYQGSHLLIEVWGTWCGPCVADMGKLHDINKKFSPKGLKMLSIAVFDTQKKVTKHREQWPMPWDHVVLNQEDSDKLMGRFQAMGVPSYILVGPDGLVLEKGFAWRSKMKKILANYLVKPEPAAAPEK